MISISERGKSKWRNLSEAECEGREGQEHHQGGERGVRSKKDFLSGMALFMDNGHLSEHL